MSVFFVFQAHVLKQLRGLRKLPLSLFFSFLFRFFLLLLTIVSVCCLHSNIVNLLKKFGIHCFGIVKSHLLSCAKNLCRLIVKVNSKQDVLTMATVKICAVSY